MRRILLVMAICGCFSFLPAAELYNAEGIAKLSAHADGKARVSLNPATGVVRFVQLPHHLGGSLAPASAKGRSSAGQAMAFFEVYGSAFGISAAQEQLLAGKIQTDQLGYTHLEYTQVHKGVPVFGAVMRVHLNPAGEIRAVNGTFIPGLVGLDHHPSIDASRAAGSAHSFTAAMPEAIGVKDLRAMEPELMVYRLGLDRGVSGENRLVYKVEVTNHHDVRWFVFVDAVSGKVIDALPGIHQALRRQVYDGGYEPRFLVWSEGNAFPFNGENSGPVNELIEGTRETYNMFGSLTNGEYLSYNGQDALMETVYRPQNLACPNANWNGVSTNYCPGFANDDTVAHEWTHAYTDFTHDLIYRWQSGALNESISDIFGEVVDILNQRGFDEPDLLRGDDLGSALTPYSAVVSIEGRDRYYIAGSALFGPSIATGAVRGELVQVEDGTGNQLGCQGVTNGAALAGKIALISRGSCPFVDKAANAQAAGAVAVLITNNESGDPISMSGTGNINIPTLMVSQNVGNLLRKLMGAGPLTVNLEVDPKPKEETIRWLTGEEIGVGFYRDMWYPTDLGDPGKVSDPEYHCGPGDPGNDHGGVHTNSSVSNHAFALLVDGGTYNGYQIQGIGLTKAAHIYWRAMVHYQHPYTGFADHADALEQAAQDLLGVPLNILTIANPPWPGPGEEQIVASDLESLRQTIAAVEFRREPELCAFQPLLDPNTPPACEVFDVNTLFSDDFEGDVSAWTLDYEAVNGEFTPRTWEQVAELPARRSGKAFYAVGTNAIGGCQVGVNDESGKLLLASPELIAPGDDAPLMVAFDHFVATETAGFVGGQPGGVDGGNLKIKVNDGGFVLVPESAFTFNGYTGELIESIAGLINTNPMAGEPAFYGVDAGSTGGVSWGRSIVDLSGLVNAGDRFQLRFEYGNDGCSGLRGWWVDDFHVYQCKQRQSVNHAPSDRWVSHVTAANGGFQTTVFVTNTSGSSADAVLQPYESDGLGLPAQTISVEAGGHVSYTSGELFGDGPVSHFSVVASESLTVTVGYRIGSGNGATAHVNESSISGRRFAIHPGEWDVVFDGMALVNLGDTPAEVKVAMTDSAGNEVASVVLDSGLAPKAKLLSVFDSLFEPLEGGVIVVTSSQPASVLFLRGTRVGVAPGYLYQTLPITVMP